MLSFDEHEKSNAHTKASAGRTVRKVAEFSWTQRIEWGNEAKERLDSSVETSTLARGTSKCRHFIQRSRSQPSKFFLYSINSFGLANASRLFAGVRHGDNTGVLETKYLLANPSFAPGDNLRGTHHCLLCFAEKSVATKS
jgi:hypothetical protein